MIKTLGKLDDELKDTYFEALKSFVYETLSYFKEIVGDYFIEFDFRRMDLAGGV